MIKITSLSMDQNNTFDAYCLSGPVKVPNMSPFSYTIEFYTDEDIRLDNIEKRLNQDKYPWLSEQDLDTLVKDKYPERFL